MSFPTNVGTGYEMAESGTYTTTTRYVTPHEAQEALQIAALHHPGAFGGGDLDGEVRLVCG